MRITPSSSFSKAELEVLNEIEGIKEIQLLEEYRDGHSPTNVYRVDIVTDRSKKVDIILKIGAKDIIEEEHDNWRTYIEGSMDKKFYAQVYNDMVKYTNTHGLIAFEFLEIGNNYSNFADYYKGDSKVDNMIDTIVTKILRPLWKSGRTDRTKIISIAEDVGGWIGSKTNSEKWKAITNYVENTLDLNRSMPGMYVKEIGRTLVNPIHHKNTHDYLPMNMRGPWGVIHGDCNIGNIRVMENGMPALIDYYHTKQGNIYDDLAKIESVIKYEILDYIPDSAETNELVNIAFHYSSELVPGELYTYTAEGGKLVLALSKLRDNVQIILNDYENTDPRLYWTNVYSYALSSIAYNQLSAGQKYAAYITAASIFTEHFASEEVLRNSRDDFQIVTTPSQHREIHSIGTESSATKRILMDAKALLEEMIIGTYEEISGGFRTRLSSPFTPPQVWTTAECSLGLLAKNEGRNTTAKKSFLEKTLGYLIDQQNTRSGGWQLFEGNYDSVQVTCYCILAELRIGQALKTGYEKIDASIDLASKYLTTAQGPDGEGGWSFTKPQRHLRSDNRTWSTALAVIALKSIESFDDQYSFSKELEDAARWLDNTISDNKWKESPINGSSDPNNAISALAHNACMLLKDQYKFVNWRGEDSIVSYLESLSKEITSTSTNYFWKNQLSAEDTVLVRNNRLDPDKKLINESSTVLLWPWLMILLEKKYKSSELQDLAKQLSSKSISVMKELLEEAKKSPTYAVAEYSYAIGETNVC